MATISSLSGVSDSCSGLAVIEQYVAHRVSGAPQRRIVTMGVPLEGKGGGGVPVEGLKITHGGSPRWARRERQLCRRSRKQIGGARHALGAACSGGSLRFEGRGTSCAQRRTRPKVGDPVADSLRALTDRASTSSRPCIPCNTLTHVARDGGEQCPSPNRLP